jgi:hypothetical protein
MFPMGNIFKIHMPFSIQSQDSKVLGQVERLQQSLTSH